MSTISSFKSIENKHDVCKGKYCTKVLRVVKKHTMQINNLKKKKMNSLTNKQQKSYQNAKLCYICKEKFEDKCPKENIVKLKTIIIIQGNIEVVLIAYVI